MHDIILGIKTSFPGALLTFWDVIVIVLNIHVYALAFLKIYCPIFLVYPIKLSNLQVEARLISPPAKVAGTFLIPPAKPKFYPHLAGMRVVSEALQTATAYSFNFIFTM